MDTDVLSKIYAQVVGGLPKEQSKYVTDDESSNFWDSIAAEVENKGGTGMFEMVNEIP